MTRILAISRKLKLFSTQSQQNNFLQVLLFLNSIFIDKTSPPCHYPGHTNYDTCLSIVSNNRVPPHSVTPDRVN